MKRRPRLIEGLPGSLLLAGGVGLAAETVNGSVCLAEALIAASKTTSAALEVAKYGSSRIIAKLVAQPELDPNDARRIIEAARIAARLAVLPKRSREAGLRPLERAQPEVARLAQQRAESMAGLDPKDEHSRCAVLRRVHADAFWLDTIMVRCPVDRVSYGSQRRPLSS